MGAKVAAGASKVLSELAKVLSELAKALPEAKAEAKGKGWERH